MLEFKNPLTIRSGHLTCPLPLALESYWACEADCEHCIGRRLNKIWGNEQRATNPDIVEKLLVNALKKENKSTLSQALFRKKTIFFGRKADPYQDIEIKERVSKRLIEILFNLDWSFAICSRYQANMDIDTRLFLKRPDLISILVEITCGLEADRKLFEHNKTTPIIDRLKITQNWLRRGLNVGVRGEPFIPGYHTLKQFTETLKLISEYGVKSYNIYNLHINEFNIKRLHYLGLDVEKIWTMNQDAYWKKIQIKLCTIADKLNIKLGCPDYLNTPNWHIQHTNTCCGINVPNPFTYNTHNWKSLLIQNRYNPTGILNKTWEGIGTDKDICDADIIINGKPSKDLYTFKQIYDQII